MNEISLNADFVASLAELKAIGRYEIRSRLGQGASGVIYKAFDPYIKRNVAIKITRPTTERAQERFFREAQYAGQLNHPNLVMIYDVGIHNNFCYLTMEYVDGPNLETFCQKGKLLPVDKILEIIFKVCEAVDYAHSKGLIHRDIKPQNILLDSNGNPKIADFGIAQMIETTSEMGVWGTASYMAPEQLKEEGISNASDIFSLGCVLYELLAGQKAFDGGNHFQIMYKITNEEPVALRRLRPDLPELMEVIVARALAKDPKDRYQNGRDLAYDLRVAMRGLAMTDNIDDTVRDAIDFVHNVSFFKNFTREQVKLLSAASTIVKVPRGKVVVAEGEIDDTFYVILSGKAKMTKQTRTVSVIGPGECFGEMAYICGQARSSTVVADTDCILMKISSTLVDRSPEAVQLLFFRNFTTALVRRLSSHDAPLPS